MIVSPVSLLLYFVRARGFGLETTWSALPALSDIFGIISGDVVLDAHEERAFVKAVYTNLCVAASSKHRNGRVFIVGQQCDAAELLLYFLERFDDPPTLDGTFRLRIVTTHTCKSCKSVSYDQSKSNDDDDEAELLPGAWDNCFTLPLNQGADSVRKAFERHFAVQDDVEHRCGVCEHTQSQEQRVVTQSSDVVVVQLLRTRFSRDLVDGQVLVSAVHLNRTLTIQGRIYTLVAFAEHYPSPVQVSGAVLFGLF